MILTPTQAEAVLAAMAHLNNVHATIHTLSMPGKRLGEEIVVKSHPSPVGTVSVELWFGGRRLGGERYAKQADFAAAYGLN